MNNSDIILYRRTQSDFMGWFKRAKRKVMKVSGCKHSGKTTEVKRFVQEHFKQVIYIDLRDEAIKERFNRVTEQGVNVDSIKSYCKESKLPAFLNKWSTIIVVDHLHEDSELYKRIVDGRKALVSCVALIIEPTYNLISRDKDREELTYPIKVYPLGYVDILLTTSNTDLHMISLSTYKRIGGYPEIVALYFKTRDEEACKAKLDKIISETVRDIDFEQFVRYKVLELWDLKIRRIPRGCVEPVGTPEVFRNMTYEEVSYNSEYDEDTINKLINNGILDEISTRNGPVIFFTDSGLENYIMKKYGVDDKVADYIIGNDFLHKDYYT